MDDGLNYHRYEVSRRRETMEQGRDQRGANIAVQGKTDIDSGKKPSDSIGHVPCVAIVMFESFDCAESVISFSSFKWRRSVKEMRCRTSVLDSEGWRSH